MQLQVKSTFGKQNAIRILKLTLSDHINAPQGICAYILKAKIQNKTVDIIFFIKAGQIYDLNIIILLGEQCKLCIWHFFFKC